MQLVAETSAWLITCLIKATMLTLTIPAGCPELTLQKRLWSEQEAKETWTGKGSRQVAQLPETWISARALTG